MIWNAYKRLLLINIIVETSASPLFRGKSGKIARPLRSHITLMQVAAGTTNALAYDVVSLASQLA